MATLYEDDVKRLLDEKKKKLEELRQNPNVAKYEIEQLEEEIGVLAMLYENYSSGMGAFRRVKGSREHR
jgi:colicin import membrane protein